MKLSPSEQDVVLALRDALIPAGPGRPSADDFLSDVERVLRVRPDIQEPFKEALAFLPTPPSVEDVKTSPQEATLVFVVAGAHYTNPGVANAIGYPAGQVRTKPLEGEQLESVRARLTQVISRGACYTPA
jgi:hypothetical protein